VYVHYKLDHGQRNQILLNHGRSHLESEGIPVFLQCESVGRVWGLVLDVLGSVKIFVPKELAEEAKKLIKDAAVPQPP
jgi:hypothetical protein